MADTTDAEAQVAEDEEAVSKTVTEPYKDANGLIRIGPQPMRRQQIVPWTPFNVLKWKVRMGLVHAIKKDQAIYPDSVYLQNRAEMQREGLRALFLESVAEEDRSMVSRLCDYTGIDILWPPGPRALSIEAVYPFILKNGHLAYHSEPNVTGICAGLNYAKGNGGVLYTVLCGLWFRTIDDKALTFQERRAKCAWINNAMCNLAILVTCVRLERSRKDVFEELGSHWTPFALRGFLETMRTGRLNEATTDIIDRYEESTERLSLLAPSKFSRFPISFRSLKDGEKLLETLFEIGEKEGLRRDEFEFYLTIWAPDRDRRVFYPWHELSRPVAEEIGWDWHHTMTMASEKVYGMQTQCNKHAEKANLGEKELNARTCVCFMAAFFSAKIVTIKHQRPDATREEVLFYNLDRLDMLLVPWTNHPGVASLCKNQDHGIAMLMGFSIPEGEKFDAVKHIDLSQRTVTIDSWATNRSMWKYSMDDTHLIRDLISRVLPSHCFWRLDSNMGNEV